ncbi:BglG family transcription antiterminator [Cohnella candidum]|uniref:PRD domain-containing protein n=1 Tax=Cohnella candidum TaxID=2674991 RepID=A0A3G3K049_9BACL|nr:BglG family transcription antiterminator [Cohnella candidum]AYQ73497.1 PRD domain-containing protein [Cohnella candidum]
MKVSNRQRRILEVLLDRPSEVTAGQLAEEIGISARTVHRELQELEPVLISHGLSLVKKSGIGITLEGDEGALASFREELRLSETETYSPDERKVLMQCLLLEEEEPVKLFVLAREVQAAIPTVSRDLDDLEPQLARSGLSLVRKRGYGVEIAGVETAKREYIVWMADEHLDHSDWFGTIDPSDQWPVTRRLLELAGKEDFLRIEQSLWQQAEEWLNGLKESDYTKLLIRLSVAVARIRSGRLVKADELVRRGEPPHGHLGFDLNRFASSLDLALNENEANFLLSLFEEARNKAADVSTVILEKYGLDFAERTLDFIRGVEGRLDIALSKDRSLLDGLIRHLGPALERIRRGESIRNPLLPQIKKDYPELFLTVRHSVGDVWKEIAIPEEEVGYLTMHFGAALERWKLTPNHLKALLVCTSGIGSSKLLAVRISKEIPQIDLIGHYSWYEASRMPEDQYDLIISTVDLPVEQDRYIKLSPLLSPDEADRLRLHVRKLVTRSRPRVMAAKRDETVGSWERLKLMSGYSKEIVGLLENFRVFELDNRSDDGDLKRLLKNLLNRLPPRVLEREDEIVQALLDREEQGSLLIPDTELALYHTRSEGVSMPVLSLFRLETPQRLGDGSGAEARQILLMLAPKTLSKPGLEVLSEISAMLLLPELVRLLEQEREEAIRAYLSRNLEVYIKNKLEWRDAP